MIFGHLFDLFDLTRGISVTTGFGVSTGLQWDHQRVHNWRHWQTPSLNLFIANSSGVSRGLLSPVSILVCPVRLSTDPEGSLLQYLCIFQKMACHSPYPHLPPLTLFLSVFHNVPCSKAMLEDNMNPRGNLTLLFN